MTSRRALAPLLAALSLALASAAAADDATPVAVATSFAAANGPTAVLLEITLPALATAATPSSEIAPGLRVFELSGETRRNGDRYESFRARFEIPVAECPDGVPLALPFERWLAPGAYELSIRVEEAATHSSWATKLPLEVPSLGTESPTTGAAGAGAPARTAGEGPSIELRLPRTLLLTGRVRVDAVTHGEGVAAVEFRIDGKPSLRKNRPPFSVELDFGKAPRLREIEAVAFDAEGRELARDTTTANGGAQRFALHFIEPRNVAATARAARAVVELEIPDENRVDRVELYVGDARRITLYQPPWALTLPLSGASGVTWFRGVAYLEGGGAAEDVALLGGRADSKVAVDFVELYTVVGDKRGRSATEPACGDLSVFEDGVRQEVRRCEPLTSLPVHTAVLLDTSGSMQEKLSEAEAAALFFFEKILTPRDRGAVIAFAEEPRVTARFSNEQARLAGGLTGLEAKGETRLYDSLAFALHYFGGIRGKRALILLTDGADTQSAMSYEEVLDFARRAGVAIYAIGLGVDRRDMDVRAKLVAFANETGGAAYFVDQAIELKSIYERIERELRSEVLLAYQSSNSTGTGYRKVEVRVARPGLSARTIRGYYP